MKVKHIMTPILSICNGCCCGHEEKSNPRVKNVLFDSLVKQNNLNVTIERPYCLGPCNMANVVKIEANNKEYWFKRINEEQDVEAVVTFLNNNEHLPQQLRGKLFAVRRTSE